MKPTLFTIIFISICISLKAQCKEGEKIFEYIELDVSSDKEFNKYEKIESAVGSKAIKLRECGILLYLSSREPNKVYSFELFNIDGYKLNKLPANIQWDDSWEAVADSLRNFPEKFAEPEIVEDGLNSVVTTTYLPLHKEGEYSMVLIIKYYEGEISRIAVSGGKY